MTEVPPPAAAPQPAVLPASVPGKTMGIVALILSFFAQLIALILGVIALNQSKAAGYPNGPAKAAIIISIILIVVGIGIAVVFIVFGGALFGNLAQVCSDLGPGVHEVGGVTYTCG
jgi:hypothetical protein